MIKQECIGIPDMILLLLKDQSRNNIVPREGLFLVGAFSFKEKSPTITVASFFFFFFVRPQSSSRTYHFLQKLIRLLRPSQANGNLVQRVPPFIFYLFYVTYKTGRDQRVPPFNFFSALCEIFSKIFQGLKRVPPSSFLIFCNRMYVNESQRVPPFHFSIFKFYFVPSRETVIFQSYRA